LFHTTVQNWLELETITEEVPYIVLRKRIQQRPGILNRVFIGFVDIDRQGYLNEDAPKLYAVTPDPIRDNSPLNGNDIAIDLLRQTHVVAEDLALRRGIFNKGARMSAELGVLQHVQGARRQDYLEYRIIHLEATRKEVLATDEPEFYRSLVADELAFAVGALRNHMPD
jgi:hypothetical protein